MNNKIIKLILFDLGGVLVELGEKPFPDNWIGKEKKFRLKDWFTSDFAIRFETGLISSNEFITELKSQLSINVSDEEVIDAFKKWPKGLFSATDGVLERLRANYEIAVLSNSNEIHEPILMHDFGLKDRIENIFFSHLIGHSKPSKEAYEYVLTKLNIQPNEVIFFDDSQDNVLSAKSLGINAHQISNPIDVNQFI